MAGALPRARTRRPLPLVYPTHFLERRVTAAGLVWLQQEDIYLSQPFAGYIVGLDPVSPTVWDLAEYLLGALDLTTLRFRTLTQTLSSPIIPV